MLLVDFFVAPAAEAGFFLVDGALFVRVVEAADAKERKGSVALCCFVETANRAVNGDRSETADRTERRTSVALNMLTS